MNLNLIKKLKTEGEESLAKRLYRVMAEDTNDKVLYEDEWFKVILRDGWYTFVENTFKNGVMVLVYNSETKKILIREETNPAHGGKVKTSVTGMMDHEEETPKATAVREVKEETGITADEKDLKSLGWVYADKGSNKQMFLFALDAKEKPMGEIKGDGTQGEKDAFVYWASLKEALSLNEPLIAACVAKLYAAGTNILT